MATKIWTGAEFVFFLSEGIVEFAPVAAAWPPNPLSPINGDTGTVTITSSFVSGSALMNCIGSLFDDGSVPSVITITSVQIEFDWSVTNGTKAGGNTSSKIEFGGIDTQGEGSFSGHFNHLPPVGDIFTTPDRAGLFEVPTIGWGFYCSYTGAFASHTRQIAISNYTITVTYTSPASVISIRPISGSVNGGQAFTIRGTGLSAVTAVTFGGTAATSIVATDTTITGVTPAHVSGAVTVTVTGVGDVPGGYTYIIPPPFDLDPLPGRTPIMQGKGT